ncbi:hypothetical protein DXA13_04205 [Clostridium sp. AM58-1XD]|nr:hypothetical protein DXA13_04205 [Clostridium sp. AM58-1XD]
MHFADNIPFISLFLMMIGGVVTPLLNNEKRARRLHIALIAAVGILSFVLLYETISGYSFTFIMGHFPAPWGNEVRAGAFEALMASVFSIVMLLSVIGNLRSLKTDIRPEKAPLYYVMMNLLFCSLLALIYTNDLFTAYVFIEINTISACAIVMAKENGETILATIRYMIMSLLGSGLILIAIAILYSQTGHLLMVPMKASIETIVSSGRDVLPLKMGLAMITVGLAVKSALYPFSSWLPGAHGSATSASSAVLSGLVLKGYIILLLKIFFRVFGLDTVVLFHMDDVLFVFGAFAMVMASVKALQQQTIKRVIAYSSISQIGYIFMGIGMGNIAGYTAAAFHIISHAATKPMLFTAAGSLMDANGHKPEISSMRGVGRQNPAAGLGIIVGGMAMIGIPFFSGFISKITFAMASFGSEKSIVTLGALAVSTVLNAMYYIPLMMIVFSAGDVGTEINEHDHAVKKPFYHAGMPFYGAMAVFIAANVFLGTCYEPIIQIIGDGLLQFG